MSLLGRQLTHKTFSLLLQRAAVHQSHSFTYSTSSSDEENSKGELSIGWRLHTLSGIAFSSQGHQQYALQEVIQRPSILIPKHTATGWRTLSKVVLGRAFLGPNSRNI